VFEAIRQEDFYSPAHRLVFNALRSLYDDNKQFDHFILKDELQKRGQLESIGGLAYLVRLTEAVPSAANALYHAEIVRNKALLRHLIEAATRIIQKSYANAEVEEIMPVLDEAETTIFSVTERMANGEVSDLKKIMIDILEKHADRKSHEYSGVPSGYSELDNITDGFQKNELVLVAARPSVGKTTFTLNILHHMSVNKRLPVAFFSLEMSADQLARHLLCLHSRTNANRLKKGELSGEAISKLMIVAGVLYDSPIYIVDAPGLDIFDIKVRARRLAEKIRRDEKLKPEQRHLGAIFIDYLQLIRPPQTKGERNRALEVADISRSLKALAKELSVPVIACAQLNRSVETRGGESRPKLADLRESGALEQDADVVLLLSKDNPEEEDENDIRKVLLQVAKNRNGRTDDVNFVFIKNELRFEPAEMRYEEPAGAASFDDASF
jgi:replicative DNA helicase